MLNVSGTALLRALLSKAKPDSCCKSAQVYGYPCDTDMSAFGLVANGLHPNNALSDYCPESCGTCGGNRLCADNNAWTDSSGRRCNFYASHVDECYTTHANIACPVSCQCESGVHPRKMDILLTLQSYVLCSVRRLLYIG